MTQGTVMTDQVPIPASEIVGVQIYKTAVPTHKTIRFLTALGPVDMMANRKLLHDIGRAMIAAAERMPQLT
jgi:hypothetical protein